MPRRPAISTPLSPQTRAALESLSTAIRAARLQRRMSQAELAERLGASRHTVMAIERGDQGVAIGTVLEAAVIVGVPLLSEDPREVGRALSATRSLLALLPSRARPVKVDDDF